MKYELVLMFKSNLTEDEAKKNINSVKEIIKSLEGNVEKEDFWGKRKLAYEINGMQEAYYTVCDINLNQPQVKKLNLKLNIEPTVVRYLLTSKN